MTRGTTGTNRLRRVDRYVAGPLRPLLRDAPARPVLVDLGYGARPWTALELYRRARLIRPDVRVLGLEIDGARVAAAKAFETDSLRFEAGGFEVPTPSGWGPPVLIRAFNVLRQYPEADVQPAWSRMVGRLAPGGVLVEGTCDEIGRRAAWVTLDATGPRWLTLSMRLAAVDRPSDIAERLPKALIHRNVPGERVHSWLSALDAAWEAAAPLRVYGARQRWLATVATVRGAGWPVLHGPARWRLGEVTIPWDHVRPRVPPEGVKSGPIE